MGNALKYSYYQMLMLDTLGMIGSPMSANALAVEINMPGTDQDFQRAIDQLVLDGHVRKLAGDLYQAVKSLDPLILVTEASSALAQGRPVTELLPRLKTALKAMDMKSSTDDLLYAIARHDSFGVPEAQLRGDFGAAVALDLEVLENRGLVYRLDNDNWATTRKGYSRAGVSPKSIDPASLAEVLADGSLVKAVMERMSVKMTLNDLVGSGEVDKVGQRYEIRTIRKVLDYRQGGRIRFIEPRGGNSFAVTFDFDRSTQVMSGDTEVI